MWHHHLGEDSFVITGRKVGVLSYLHCVFQRLVHGPFLESINLFSSWSKDSLYSASRSRATMELSPHPNDIRVPLVHMTVSWQLVIPIGPFLESINLFPSRSKDSLCSASRSRATMELSPHPNDIRVPLVHMTVSWQLVIPIVKGVFLSTEVVIRDVRNGFLQNPPLNLINLSLRWGSDLSLVWQGRGMSQGSHLVMSICLWNRCVLSMSREANSGALVHVPRLNFGSLGVTKQYQALLPGLTSADL